MNAIAVIASAHVTEPPMPDHGIGSVLVADDHDLVRETVAEVLRAHGIGHVVTAPCFASACKLVEKEGGFDLVLLDRNMPGMVWPEGIAEMLALNGRRPVGVLSGCEGSEMALDVARVGGAGFLRKDLRPREIVAAVRQMASMVVRDDAA